MKIYQIHRQSGTCDDTYDYIIASYLDKNKAENHLLDLLNKLTERTKQSEKCQKCPLYRLVPEDVSSHDIYDYCNKADIYQDDDEFECKNENIEYWIEYEDYRLKEVDVIE